MGANYSHTTRSTGTVLTDTIYNEDHNNHITNMIPTIIDDYSANVTTMKVRTDPYPGSVESLATSLSGELERIRYVLRDITKQVDWFNDSPVFITAASPTLVTPDLGTPSAGVLTNCTGLPVASGISGLGSNVATFLATASSANLLAAMTDETGSNLLVFNTSPTLVTPLLGTPTSGILTNCTGIVAGLTAGAVSTITGLAPDTATTQATQGNITSLGTLTTLTVDDITINGNTISSAGASTLAITPTAGQVITFDGTVTLDAGVIAGATSITSTAFIGALTGNADTVTTNANLTGVVTSTGNATAIAAKALSIDKLADGTDGELITWDTLGVVTTVAVGTATEVLTSNGVGAAPTFQAAAVGIPGMDDVGGVARATSGLLFNTDTAAENTLDDYEEGTWDAIIGGSGTAATMEAARTTMRYTKIGRMVYVHGQCAMDNKGDMGAGDEVQIKGLPFANGAGTDKSENSTGLLNASGITFTGEISVIINSEGSTTLLLRETVSGGGAIIVPTSDLTTTADFYLSLTYSV